MSLYPTHDTGSASVAKRVQAAIKVARAGDRFTARRMLLDIVETDPTQEDVWLWLAGLSEDLEEAKIYLETVLALNPAHTRATEGLRIIEQRLAAQSKVMVSPPAAAKPVPVAPPPAHRICEVCGTRIPENVEACPACARAMADSTPEDVAAAAEDVAPAAEDVAVAAEDIATVTEDVAGEVEDVAGAEEDILDVALDESPVPLSPTMSDVNAEITPSFTLSVEQAEAIDTCLERMAYESEASCIILADVTGQLISERGKTVGMNTQVLSALAAGELSATQEMARLVGERARFSLLLHEGEQRSVYLSPVGQKMLLIVVFDGRTPIGLVRIIIKNAVDELGPILTRPSTRGSGESLGEALGGDFAQQLEDEMDASLDMLTYHS